MEDDIEIEFPSGGLLKTSGDKDSAPRPLLNLDKLRSQRMAENDQTPGNNELAKELGEEIRATKSFKKGDQIWKDYSVMLNRTDVAYGVKGSNKYYRIQILRAKERYILYTQWGRVGAKKPQSMNEEFSSESDVVKAFKKKFWDKTRTKWEDREDFQAQTGKYVIISLAEDGMGGADSINQEIQRLNKRNQEIKQKIETQESRLEPRIFSLMKLVWDINRMNRTLRELNFDTEKNPLGKLAAEQIQKGYRVLSEIKNVLDHDAKETKLIELTNEFYTNIPQNIGWGSPPLINNLVIFREKVRLLDALKELEVANKYINLALFQKGAEVLNPLDLFFDLLKIKLNLVSPADNAYVAIQNCLQLTHGPTHNQYSLSVTDVFEVQRKGENERFFPFKKLNNRALLWHGSRMTNFVGILSEGLRIAPPEAPVTGYMFGKGVYFADVPSKSARYCKATRENPEGILLLCEVALGDMYRVYKEKAFQRAPKYFHSVYGVGKKKPTNENRIYLEDGLALEVGEVKDNKELEDTERGRIESKLDYNEFVVYDVGQVRIRYLVKVRFNFNSL